MRRSLDCQSVMNRIMLRFRPIAPKPVDGGVSASGAAETEMGKSGARGRPKRKYVRVRGRQDKTKVTEDKSPPAEKVAVTLQLLPERSEENSNNTDPRDVDDGVGNEGTAESSVEGASEDSRDGGSVVETSIIVERVTDRFAQDKVGLGFSDEEKMCSLEKDTCPGFVSDWTNNVIWVNEAYKNMVAAAAEDGETAAEKGFLVCLVVKDELPHLYPSFACRARVLQRRGQGQKWNKVVPCDVWRMEFARLAWKLDVNTALSLSL